MLSRYKSLFEKFVQHERGAVAILFSFFVLMLMLIVGIAIDTSRSINARMQASQALDAATLAAAKAMNEQGLNDTELLDIAKTVFLANTEQTVAGANFKEVQISIDRTDNSVSAFVDGTVNATFTKLFNISQIPIQSRSTVSFNIKDIELALMLDTTGSMKEDNGQKLRDLKDAAKDLINILVGSGSQANKTRIALAPYAGAVNVGPYADQISNGASLDGCIVERENDRFIDDAPTKGKYFRSIEMANIEARQLYNSRYKHYRCPKSTIQPLTDNTEILETQIDNLRARGYTAGHLGIGWAWYLVSPLWSNIWPDESRPEAYGKQNLIKAVVLMTDGRFNTAYTGNPSNQKDRSYDDADRLCNQMKDNDIIIYSVAFKAPLDAREALESCASATENYFNAENGAELRQAFRSIAIRLSNIRISE